MCEPAFLALGLMIKQWERTSHEADDFNNNIVEIYGLREPRSCARSLEPSKRGVTRRAARAKRVTTVTSVTQGTVDMCFSYVTLVTLAAMGTYEPRSREAAKRWSGGMRRAR